MEAHTRPAREVEPEDEVWSQEKVADYFDVTVKTVRDLIATGELPAFRLAGRRLIRVRKSDAMALLEPIPTTQKVAG